MNTTLTESLAASRSVHEPERPDTFEMACIGSLISVDSEDAIKLAAAAPVELFHGPRNQHAWRVLRQAALGRSPLGLDTAIATIAQSAGLLESFSGGGEDVREHLLDCLSVSREREDSWPRYVTELKLSHTRRVLVNAMDNAIVDAASAPTAAEATNLAIGRVIDTAAKLRVVTGTRDESIEAAAKDFLEDYAKPDDCVPFPQPNLNTLGGVRPSEVVIMTAPTGTGKSLWQGGWIIDLLEAGIPVWLYSLEMGRKQQLRRLLCIKYGWDMLDLVQRKLSPERVAAAVREFSKLPLKIFDRNITAGKIHSDIATAGLDKPGFVFVDHIHLLPVSGAGDDLSNFNQMINGFKPCAVENDLTVVLLAQMRRPQGTSDSNPPRPHMGMLKGSSAIEQIADYIIFLWKQVEQAAGSSRDHYEMWTEKQRDGEACEKFPVVLEKLRFVSVG